MNIEKIKEIVLDGFPSKEERILLIISEDKYAIPSLLRLLDSERSLYKKLTSDLNYELSRSLSYIVENKRDVRKTGLCRAFMIGEIVDLYIKYKGRILNTFSGTQWAKNNKLDI